MVKKANTTEEPVTPAEELLTGVEGDENTTVTPVEPEAPTAPEVPQEPVEPAPAPAQPSAAASEGSEIAKAIAQGMKEAKGDKTIKMVVDKSVTPRYGVVRSKRTGEVMLRETATGVLSKVQLESLEEKEASIQGEEVEPARG
jgi:hypothetical protein